MSVLNNYNLSFINKSLNLDVGGIMNRKIVVHNVPKDFLGYFLNEIRDSEDDIITDINVVIAEGSYDPEYNFDIFLGDNFYVKYTNNSLEFYDDFGGNLYQEIPFNDMIVILQLWKTFNQTPPLHNQIL